MNILAFPLVIFIMALAVSPVPVRVNTHTYQRRQLSSDSSFSEREAREKLFMSSAAYCHNKTALFDWSCLPCQNATDIQPFQLISNETTETFGYIALDRNESLPVIYVVFRGTVKDLPNIFIDGESYETILYPDRFPEAKVHAGFHYAYNSIQAPFLEALVRALKTFPSSVLPKVAIEFTGHSLGAALATIAAVDVRLYLSDMMGSFSTNPMSLYSFGSPRVGNQPFTELFTKCVQTSYRVTHWRDIVVHLPPKTSIIGEYMHVIGEVFYDEDCTNYKICSSDEGNHEDPTCAAQFGVLTSLLDHRVYFGTHVGGYCNGK